jgi:hypothetical protein
MDDVAHTFLYSVDIIHHNPGPSSLGQALNNMRPYEPCAARDEYAVTQWHSPVCISHHPRLMAFTPRYRVKSKSCLQREAQSLPHSTAIEEISSARSRPTFIAVSRKLGLRCFRILVTIIETIPARTRLLIRSTQRMVRSTMPRSTRDKALNQILCLTARVLVFMRPCLVNNETASPLTLFS